MRQTIRGTFCCECGWEDKARHLIDGPGPFKCRGCGHMTCGNCGFTTTRDGTKVYSAGWPKEKGQFPQVAYQ